MSPSIDIAYLRRCLSAKLRSSAVAQELLNKGLPHDVIDSYVKAYEQKLASRQLNAFLFLGVGALLGFISCVLSLLNAVPHLYNVILYGLTALAIIVIFIGLYLLFE